MKERKNERHSGEVSNWDAAFVAISVMLLMANIVGKLGLWEGFKGSIFGIIVGVVLLLSSIYRVIKHRGQ